MKKLLMLCAFYCTSYASGVLDFNNSKFVKSSNTNSEIKVLYQERIDGLNYTILCVSDNKVLITSQINGSISSINLNSKCGD